MPNVKIDYDHLHGKLAITPGTHSDSCMMFAHSDTCFSRRYSKQSQVYDRGFMKLAVNLVVCDNDNKTFLTLRSKKLRVFPNAWVLPGGHIDPGETLEEGALRELSEETGINISRAQDGSLTFQGHTVSLSPYFAFESSILSY
jgi:8-oxo-dGTP pyrophosphatase MutT (NUDIX family)